MKGRIRTSKPELWKHWLLWHLGEQTSMPKLAFWYEGIWHWTDREGRFEWSAQRLKSEVAPYDAIDFEHVLNVLANTCFVMKYRVGPRFYGWVPRFLVHQSINGKEEASRLPEPPRSALLAYDALTLQDGFGDLPAQALVAAPIVYCDQSESPNPLADNDLHDASRVTHASAQGDAPVRHAYSIPFHSIPSKDSALQQELVVKEANGTHAANGTAIESSSALSLDTLSVSARGARALPAVRGPRNAVAIRDRLSTVFSEIAEQSRTRVSVEQLRKMQAEMVFLYWSARFVHPQALLDKKRETKIIARLNENDGNVSELLYALDGATHDKFIMGENDAQKRYDDIVTLLRDRAQVERFATTRKPYREGKPHKLIPSLEAALRGEGTIDDLAQQPSTTGAP